MISPKIEMINYFDNLINKVDFDIELCLEKCNDEQILGKLLKNSEADRKNFRNKKDLFNVEFRTTIDSSKTNIWPESIKLADYLNQVRMQTIEELRKSLEERLEYYKLNSSQFKSLQIENEFKSELFADSFYFQVNLTQPLWNFNVFTFATDFYMSQSDINLLEYTFFDLYFL